MRTKTSSENDENSPKRVETHQNDVVWCRAFEGGKGRGVVVVVCYDRRARSVFLSRNERSKFATQFSIFGLPTKLTEMTLNRRRTVLCFAHREGVNVVVVVYYDRRARTAFLSSYERSKFATQFFDFWRTTKTKNKRRKRVFERLAR